MKKIIQMVVILLIIASYSSIIFAQNSFVDIKGHWAEQMINEMSAKGIIEGMDDSHFAPDMEITRAQYIVLIHRLLDININYLVQPDIESVFQDVNSSDWYSNNLIDVATTGIIDDITYFRPNDKISREEAIYYLIRAYDYINEDDITKFNVEGEVIQVDDINNADLLYKENILLAYKYNLVQGRTENDFVPKGLLTRAESLIVIDRLENLIENKINIVHISAKYSANEIGIDVAINILNKTNEEVNLAFSSGQRYNIYLLNKNDDILYNWEADKSFIQAFQFIEIKPDERVTFNELLEFSKFNDLLSKTAKIKVQISGKIAGDRFEDIVLEYIK